MIEIKFRVKGDDREYDETMDAVNRAAFLSQMNDGDQRIIERGVKYTRRNEFEWMSLCAVSLPLTGEDGPVASETLPDGREINAYTKPDDSELRF